MSRSADRAVALARPVIPALVGLVAFGLARRALLPGQALWDTGEFQFVGPLLGTAHPTGYPAYVLLGWAASALLAPLGDPAFRMNLLSAILLGVATAGTAAFAARLAGGRMAVGAAAGLVLALSPTAWRMGTFADPHTLHLVLLLPLLVLLVGWEDRRRRGRPGADRWLIGAAAAFGLAMANHSLTLLLAPGIVLFLLAVEPGIVRRGRLIAACAAALFGTATLFYLELPLRAATGAPFVYGHPDTWGGFWYVVLGQQFGGAVNPLGDLVGKVTAVAGEAWHGLGLLAPLIPAAFLVTAVRRPRYALLTGTWLLVTSWFAASYVNADIERYYLGPLLLVVTWLAILAGFVADTAEAYLGAMPPGTDGDDGLLPAVGGEVAEPGVAGVAADAMAALFEPRPLARAAISVAIAAAMVLPGIAAAPATLALVDRSGDTIAGRWSQWVLATVPRDSVILSWWVFSTPLWYRTLELGERPDVTILDDRTLLDRNLGTVDDAIRSNLGRRPVFLVRMPNDLASLETRWRTTELVDPNGLQPLVEVVSPATGSSGG